MPHCSSHTSDAITNSNNSIVYDNTILSSTTTITTLHSTDDINRLYIYIYIYIHIHIYVYIVYNT